MGHGAFLCCSHILQPLHWPSDSLTVFGTYDYSEKLIKTHSWLLMAELSGCGLQPSALPGLGAHTAHSTPHVQNLSSEANLHRVYSTGDFTLHLQSPALAQRWLTEDRQKEANISTLPSMHSFLFFTANTTI